MSNYFWIIIFTVVCSSSAAFLVVVNDELHLVSRQLLVDGYLVDFITLQNGWHSLLPLLILNGWQLLQSFMYHFNFSQQVSFRLVQGKQVYHYISIDAFFAGSFGSVGNSIQRCEGFGLDSCNICFLSLCKYGVGGEYLFC